MKGVAGGNWPVWVVRVGAVKGEEVPAGILRRGGLNVKISAKHGAKVTKEILNLARQGDGTITLELNGHVLILHGRWLKVAMWQRCGGSQGRGGLILRVCADRVSSGRQGCRG